MFFAEGKASTQSSCLKNNFDVLNREVNEPMQPKQTRWGISSFESTHHDASWIFEADQNTRGVGNEETKRSTSNASGEKPA